MSRFSLKLSNSTQLLNHFSSCKPSHSKRSIQLRKICIHACIFHKYNLTFFVMSAKFANDIYKLQYNLNQPFNHLTIKFGSIYMYIAHSTITSLEHGGGKYMILEHKIRCLCWMHERCMWGHHRWSLQGCVWRSRRFPPMHGNQKHQMWWKSLAWSTRATCPPRISFSWMLFCIFDYVL